MKSLYEEILEQKQIFDANEERIRKINQEIKRSKQQKKFKTLFIFLIIICGLWAVLNMYHNHLESERIWQANYGQDIYPDIKTISNGLQHINAGTWYKYLGYNFDGSIKSIQFTSSVDNNQVFTRSLSNGYVEFSIEFSDDNFVVNEVNEGSGESNQIPFFHNPSDYK